jgi:hypothetical protein
MPANVAAVAGERNRHTHTHRERERGCVCVCVFPEKGREGDSTVNGRSPWTFCDSFLPYLPESHLMDTEYGQIYLARVNRACKRFRDISTDRPVQMMLEKIRSSVRTL